MKQAAGLPWPPLALGLLLSCAPEEQGPKSVPEPPQGNFAVVGETSLSFELLRGVSQGSIEAAAHGIVHDELFRQGALEMIPGRARAAERAVLSRALLERISAEVALKHPITARDLEAHYRKHWVKFDRPRTVRTAQLFLKVEPMQDDRAAFAEAERVYAAVKGTHNLEDFVTLGRQASQSEVTATSLPPVTADGRIAPILPQDNQFQTIDLALAKAAVALKAPSDISGIVGTEHGFHILFATEIIPEERHSVEEVRPQLTRDLLTSRVQQQIETLKKSHKTAIEYRRTDISALLRQVQKEQ